MSRPKTICPRNWLLHGGKRSHNKFRERSSRSHAVFSTKICTKLYYCNRKPIRTSCTCTEANSLIFRCIMLSPPRYDQFFAEAPGKKLLMGDVVTWDSTTVSKWCWIIDWTAFFKVSTKTGMLFQSARSIRILTNSTLIWTSNFW